MCGIAGFVSWAGGQPDRGRLARMVATLRHRGPDDTGHFVEGPVALGAARLSIIDVAGGHQPISIDGGAITVSQNGEIYNYVELRDEIERAGRRMTTTCDTEVIGHLYAREGVSALRKMRGMFAVALWDAPRHRLVLARDRVGKKPLYYFAHDGELLYGSETKAILAGLERGPGVDAEALLGFFTFGYVAGQSAAFQGMKRLEPGTALTIDGRSGAMSIDRFWDWPQPSTSPMTEQEAVERLRAELTEAVRIRLRSDVPLGAFLSGGMDSAAVLALMARQSSRPVKTFTIGFGDSAYDELEEARRTAAHFGAAHHEQIVMPNGIAVAETLAVHYDEPFADASAIPTFYVAELARKHVTVCLTGDGGDELFAGYTPYADALARVGSTGVTAFRNALSVGAKLVPVHARGKGRLTTLSLGPEAWFIWRRTVFPDYLLEAVVERDLLAAASELPEHRAVADLREAPGPLLSRLQQWDKRHYLPDDILVKVDRATMAHSLEARCPILDHRVAELAANQPAERHGNASTTKRLFREVIREWVPAEVLDRPKRGFGVPLRRWFQEGLTPWAREILLDSRTRQRGWTRTSEVAALLLQHELGSRDHAKRIWALVCLELWARQHVDYGDNAQARHRACA
jgi:asparagine synthase (glutamine-hydrolysing)